LAGVGNVDSDGFGGPRRYKKMTREVSRVKIGRVYLKKGVNVAG
jgi:hypothetical protein